MNKKLFALSCVALVWAVSSPASQTPDKQPPIELKWKLVAGQSFYQEITTETEQKMKVQGLEVAQTQRQTFWLKWTPKKETDKTWIIEQEIIGVTMDISIGGNHIGFDSRAPNKPNPLTDFFKALVGAKLVLAIDLADMKIQKIDGLEGLPEKLGNRRNEAFRWLVDGIVGRDALKQMAEPIFGFLPPVGGTVPSDKKWTRTTTINKGPIGSYETTSTLKYEGTNQEKLCEIRHSAKLTYQPTKENGARTLPYRIVQVDLKTTEGTGTIVFDRVKGRLDRSNLKLTLEGSLTIDVAGTNTQVDIWQTQTTTVRVTDTNPLQK